MSRSFPSCSASFGRCEHCVPGVGQSSMTLTSPVGVKSLLPFGFGTLPWEEAAQCWQICPQGTSALATEPRAVSALPQELESSKVSLSERGSWLPVLRALGLGVKAFILVGQLSAVALYVPSPCQHMTAVISAGLVFPRAAPALICHYSRRLHVELGAVGTLSSQPLIPFPYHWFPFSCGVTQPVFLCCTGGG